MKYLISADLHLNERIRFEDFVRNLKAIEKISSQTKPDSYVLVGDIFDKRKPSPLELKTFAKHLATMLTIVKQINISVGNHDWIDKSLTTLDWIINERIKIAKEIKLKDKGKTILLMHRTITEAKLGPKEIHINGISYKQLKYDVIISGHIHKPQILSKKPLVLIPGSIERVNFGERKEEKFVWLLNVSKKDIKLTKHPLECRPMYYVEINLEEHTIKVNDEKQSHDYLASRIKNAILKVKFYAKRSTIDKINYDKLQAKFAEAYQLDFHFEYTDTVSKFSQIKVKEYNDEEFLEIYCKENGIREAVKKVAIKIIKGNR